MPRVRAITNWAEHKAGDEFDLTDDEARILCTPDLVGGQRAEYVDRVIRAEESKPAPTPTPSSSEPQAKRRYMRRDMQAQN